MCFAVEELNSDQEHKNRFIVKQELLEILIGFGCVYGDDRVRESTALPRLLRVFTTPCLDEANKIYIDDDGGGRGLNYHTEYAGQKY